MKISIPRGNKFSIQIYIKKSKISGSKVFRSNDSFKKNINKIELATKNMTAGEEVVLKLVDMKKKKTKNIYVKVNVGSNPRKVIEDIKSEFNGMEICEPKGKFRVVIDNLQTGHLDKRAFSMRFDGDISDFMIATRELLEIIVKEQADDSIVFTHEKNVNYTHRVFIQKSGTMADYHKLNCKSFSIKLPNYSSEEIINLMRGKIQNGKK